MKKTRNIALMGMLLAAGLVLPPFIRMIPNGGNLFSPMHIPPLLAGMILGPAEGIIIGILCPVLNHILYGLPQGTTFISMCFELPIYGLVSGICMYLFRNRKDTFKVYISLILAMIAGRITGGIIQAFILGASYSLQIWATSYFIVALPAIIIHLILIPSVYFALQKAGHIRK